MLKVEYPWVVVQVRLRGCAEFPADGGIEIRHRFAPRMPRSGRRMVDFWEAEDLPAPRTGRGGGKEDRTLAKVMLGLRAGKSPHQMTGDIYGASHVAADWYSDGGMRSQIRRWIPEAKALAEGGWRDLVPRHVTGE